MTHWILRLLPTLVHVLLAIIGNDVRHVFIIDGLLLEIGNSRNRFSHGYGKKRNLFVGLLDSLLFVLGRYFIAV